jgi:lipopolysaccharide export system permease protein
VPAFRRKWYWTFLQAYVVCYIAMVGLFIVIDAFSNLDEFAKRADDIVGMAQVMGRYYLYELGYYSASFCGAVAVMAAVPTILSARRKNLGV